MSKLAELRFMNDFRPCAKRYYDFIFEDNKQGDEFMIWMSEFPARFSTHDQLDQVALYRLAARVLMDINEAAGHPMTMRDVSDETGVLVSVNGGQIHDYRNTEELAEDITEAYLLSLEEPQ